MGKEYHTQIDKLDVYCKNSDVTDTEVAQNIESKIDYLTIRINRIDMPGENFIITYLIQIR